MTIDDATSYHLSLSSIFHLSVGGYNLMISQKEPSLNHQDQLIELSFINLRIAD